MALETLKIYEERDIMKHIRSIVPTFQSLLRSYADHPYVGEVRGVGLIGAIEFVSDKSTRAAFDRKLGIGATIAAAAQKSGLLIRALGDTIGFCPPLIITEAEVKELFARFAKAVEIATPEIKKIAAAAK